MAQLGGRSGQATESLAGLMKAMSKLGFTSAQQTTKLDADFSEWHIAT
jgi:hypothetical protein